MDISNNRFQIHAQYQPAGDQPQAIEALSTHLNNNVSEQILLGATGTGKTFTIANVIQNVQKPTLVIAHNKTLAGQLYGELKEFFPENAVEYFVSYYDYYQPEAYVPSSDTYIEKDASINDEIDKLRHSATSSLLERNDVIVVASVSCIYGLGNPKTYREQVLSLRVGMLLDREALLERLINMQFHRNDIDLQRGMFRVRGDIVEIFPASRSEYAIRVEFFGDEIERIVEIMPVTGQAIASRKHIAIFPATHFLTDPKRLDKALAGIEEELIQQVKYLTEQEQYVEAQRLEQRTRYDLEMIREMGYCSGIENYSRYMDDRAPGEAPYTLLDFFPDDFLTIIDESHVTVPQIRGMYNGDQARKQMLVDHGFRLPSALDNRPLTLPEVEQHLHQVIYVSATPGPYELNRTDKIIEQVIRPTGLLDPKIELHPTKHQIDHLISEIHQCISQGERVFITTLTKKMAEDLTKYLKELNIAVSYLHSDIKTLERAQIIHELRAGVYDVLIGINLLREGLDVPEVALLAILDADKEGFLRSDTALIQMIGRVARNAQGRVIMYADKMTGSMQRAIDETKRRRAIQEQYNLEHGIVPKTIQKELPPSLHMTEAIEDIDDARLFDDLTEQQKVHYIQQLEERMQEAAEALDFETAAQLRDIIFELTAK